MTIWRVPVVCTWPGIGSPGVNVWHVRCNSGLGADATELQSAVDSIHTFYDAIGPSAAAPGTPLRASIAFTLGQVVEVDSQTAGAPTWSTLTVGGAMGSTADVLQLCLSWKTTIAARRGRGRTFIGPLNSNVVTTDGTPRDDYVTLIKAAAQGLVDRNDNLNGWAVAIYGQQSMLKGPTVTPEMRQAAPHVARDIIGYSMQDKFAVLRSRRD